ncbi:MAG: PAS domain-containing sensor histidine kinase [Gammaproteobacteria bacterium]|nr:PAS domain-containing sensor histidine kinase [Gammaproteobacteria bacterium]MCW8987970.1 PAS domain-containing sensor histidine kinase [Gammaproteobacteria bacterium]
MTYIIDQYELDIDLTDYINKHALIIDMQANPIAIFNESSSLLYANTALNNLLNTNDSIATIELFNVLFRGIKQVISSCINENKAKILNKVVKDKVVDQLIPYKIKIIPVTHMGQCQGVYVIVETDVARLVDYFVEEKSVLSNTISALTVKHQNMVKLVTALFDNSPVGMMILDKQNKIIKINNSGAHILDVKPATTIGVHISRFYLADDEHCLKDESVSLEVQAVTSTGKKKILMRCSVESEDEEQDTFRVETFVDVSEIERARVAAERANKAKSEFLANMSHELRTPLHTIMGFSECGLTLDEKLDTDKVVGFFKKIHHGGEILLALVDNLLDVAKLETGKIAFNFKLLQFDELVKEVIQEFDVIAHPKDVNFVIEIKNIIKIMAMDEMRMQQVVRNIISNAVKFTKNESEILVTLEQMDKYIQLRVYDRGPGIPEDELENIFDKFIQSSRTKTGAGGTGLGLSICREIINQHNGVIWAENNPQGGAVFILNLYLNKLI